MRVLKNNLYVCIEPSRMYENFIIHPKCRPIVIERHSIDIIPEEFKVLAHHTIEKNEYIVIYPNGKKLYYKNKIKLSNISFFKSNI